MNKNNEWIQFLSGQKAMIVQNLVEYKTICDFMEDIGIQNNTDMSKINKMLDKTENMYISFDENQNILVKDNGNENDLTIESLRSYFDSTKAERGNHYTSYIDRIIWNTFEQDICSNVVNYEMLDGMSEKKTLKEKEQYCIRYVYNEVSEERNHKERYSDASGLYKKPVDKKQLKLFADYVLYHWRNNEDMRFRKIVDRNGFVDMYDMNGNDVYLCKEHNIKLYQKYIKSIASKKYPYDKYPQMYLAYEKGGIKHIDFLTYKLKDTNKDDYAIFDKKAWTLAKADKEYVELKPFDIERFLNEEFELMPNYKGKEEIVNQHKVVNTVPLNKISFEDVDLKYLKNNKEKNDKVQQNLKSKNTHSEYE